jgi:hypothetical protein
VLCALFPCAEPAAGEEAAAAEEVVEEAKVGQLCFFGGGTSGYFLHWAVLFTLNILSPLDELGGHTCKEKYTGHRERREHGMGIGDGGSRTGGRGTPEGSSRGAGRGGQGGSHTWDLPS